MNLGLRTEYDTPVTERFNRSATTFLADQASPIAAQAIANYAKNPIPELPAAAFKVNGGLAFASKDARDLWNGNGLMWMPRFGIAYQWDDKTVIRSGVKTHGARLFSRYRIPVSLAWLSNGKQRIERT